MHFCNGCIVLYFCKTHTLTGDFKLDNYEKLIKENKDLKKRLKEFTDSMLLKERFLKNVLTFPGIICECDENLKLQYLNDFGKTIFDVEDDDIKGNSVLNYIELKDQSRLVEHAKAIFKGDYGVPKIYSAISSKGEQFDIIVSSAPVVTKDQSIRIRSTIIKCDKEKDEKKETIFQTSSYDNEEIYSTINSVVKKDMDNIKSYEMIVQSSKMKQIVHFIDKIKDVPSSVLISGESGTGKELIARQIHEKGSRKNAPFVAINCGALPENLLESELFGYEAGAFTGANKRKKGKFEQAQGGILFLDEIGEMSLNMQVKLLRVLQDKVVVPLGGETGKTLDFKLLFATNKNLLKMTESGDFRGDLYYRIKSFQINLPPLRSRKEEIPYLCNFFIQKFNQMFNKNVKCVNSKVLDLFNAHKFPGNIRELQHLIEYGTIFCKSDEICINDLPAEFCEMKREIIEEKIDQKLPLKSIVNDYLDEKEVIIANIIKAGGNKTLAASRMGIHKTTLYRKMKNYQISSDMLIGKV